MFGGCKVGKRNRVGWGLMRECGGFLGGSEGRKGGWNWNCA